MSNLILKALIFFTCLNLSINKTIKETAKTEEPKENEENYFDKFTKYELKISDKSIFKEMNLYEKFPDVGTIPMCGAVKCQNNLIGKFKLYYKYFDNRFILYFLFFLFPLINFNISSL